MFKNVPVLRELSNAQLTHSQMLKVMCKTTLLVSIILRKITCIADNSCGCHTSLLKRLKTKATRLETLFVEKASVSFFKHITPATHLKKFTFIAQSSDSLIPVKLPLLFGNADDLVQVSLSKLVLKNVLLTRAQVNSIFCDTFYLESVEMWNVVSVKESDGPMDTQERSDSHLKHISLYQTCSAGVALQTRDGSLCERIVHTIRNIAMFPYLETVSAEGLDIHEDTEELLELIKRSIKLNHLRFSNMSMNIGWLLEMVVIYKSELEVELNNIKPLGGIAIQPLKQWPTDENIQAKQWEINICDNFINIWFIKPETYVSYGRHLSLYFHQYCCPTISRLCM